MTSQSERRWIETLRLAVHDEALVRGYTGLQVNVCSGCCYCLQRRIFTLSLGSLGRGTAAAHEVREFGIALCCARSILPVLDRRAVARMLVDAIVPLEQGEAAPMLTERYLDPEYRAAFGLEPLGAADRPMPPLDPMANGSRRLSAGRGARIPDPSRPVWQRDGGSAGDD